MSLENMLALLIVIIPILVSWDGAVGASEDLAMLEYSLMARKMVASGLA